MNGRSHLKPLSRLAPLLVALAAVLALFPVDTAAAYSAQQGQEPPEQSQVFCGQGLQDRCVPLKIIPQFVNKQQIQNKGFYLDLFGSGSLSFAREAHRKYASFQLDTDPSGQYSASRMTEADTSLPPEQRVKCWQPTAKRDIVIDFAVRFKQASTPPDLTENLTLWNSPMGKGGEALPMTAIGVARNQMFPGYIAVVAQNLVMAPEPSGFLQVAPMPDWLDPTDWHQIRIRVSRQKVLIEAAQGKHAYTAVQQVALPQPLDEPLAFEFSLDNEVFPGVVVPITVPDTLDVAFLSIRYALPIGFDWPVFTGVPNGPYDKPLSMLARFVALLNRTHR
jgi:hypothetical protein